MKFLLDENIPPSLAVHLQNIGYDSRHIVKIGFKSISDNQIIDIAIQNQETIITLDLDFSEILAFSGQSKPSVVQIRTTKVDYKYLFQILEANLNTLAEDIENGSIISITDNGIRIRELPIRQM
ncbi:MAG: DUF5615 family PIN-like protein [Bacteroidota bacterium]|nr:DUF5615 family PIN-like protein [Bacteroidota bacterium]